MASRIGDLLVQAPNRAERVLNAVLILTLDHEINVSSFTSRVVASAGSSLYEAVNAAMCAFSGSRHGRASERAEQFIRELWRTESGLAVIHARLRSGEEIPGFGHPLYPAGDPRAKLILQLLAEDFPAEFAKIQRRIKDAERLLRKSANLDLAVAVVSKVLALPAAFRIPPVRFRPDRRLDRARSRATSKRWHSSGREPGTSASCREATGRLKSVESLFRIRNSTLFRPDHDLDAAIELLFFHRPFGRHDQARLAVTLCLDSIRVDTHVFDQPGFHRFGSALAQVHIVLVAAERVRVAFDPEDRLRVPLDQAPQFLKTCGRSRPQVCGVVIKQEDRSASGWAPCRCQFVPNRIAIHRGC